MNMAECQTPGSLIVKACVKETPKSTRGSSMFSPGEAFWEEAIQLADGLAVPMGNDSSKAMEESNVMGGQVEMKNSCNLQNYDGKARKILDQSKNIGLTEMHTKDSAKEASSLPVKHFDFSYEDNNMDENTLQNCRVDNLVNVTCVAGKQYDSISVASHTYEQPYKVQEKILADSSGNKVRKDSFFNISSNNFNSPNNEARTKINIHASLEAKTPSSHVSLDDQLDLHSWLPPEICNIYRKKGISKLYNWQVQMHFMSLYYTLSSVYMIDIITFVGHGSYFFPTIFIFFFFPLKGFGFEAELGLYLILVRVFYFLFFLSIF
jgi:DNA polymerase theta